MRSSLGWLGVGRSVTSVLMSGFVVYVDGMLLASLHFLFSFLFVLHGFADPEGAGDFGGEPVGIVDDLFVELAGGEPMVEAGELEELVVLGDFAGAVALEDDDRLWALVI